jgi:gliding motility-associated-like protein
MNLRIIVIFISFSFCAVLSHAQPYVSDLGRFEVDEVKGCAPLTVTVTIRPPFVCNGANPCDMDFENNGGFLQNTFTHTYTQPGTYTLRILFQTSGFDQITIVVTPNVQPSFEVYSCGGNGAQVKVTDTNYSQYVINYNDGSPIVVVPSGSLAKDTHTFATGGNKNITVRGRNLNADDNCNPMNQAVNAVATLPTATITQLTVLDNASIQLDYNNQQNILYKLQIATNSTNFQQLQDVYNVNNTVINNLRPDDNFYCFRLGAFDPCNNTTVYSNVICSSNFDVTLQSDLNQLTWLTSSTGVGNYSITKTGSAPLSAIATASSLDDTNVTCGTDYCYQITANYTNGSSSISLEKCGTAFSSKIPVEPQNVSTVVGEDNGVDLEWTQDPAFIAASYNIVKSGTVLDTSTLPVYSDASYAAGDGSCYKISYTDACGNKSLQSPEACPMFLTGVLGDNNIITLTWSAYTGWMNGVDHYLVEKFNEQGQLLQTFDTGVATSLVDDEEDFDNQIYVYRITAVANDAGVTNSISNTIVIIKEPNLSYPTAFTPNGDNKNDIFKVFSQFTSAVEFKIFNRWGELLFITDDLDKGWDGTYKGSSMPEGTYVFRAFLTDLAGRTSERSGTVVLLRKSK